MDRVGPSHAWRMLLVSGVAVAVAVAFADSSIVVLALPELYARFDTTIEGVAWVITAYNLALALAGLLLVFLVHRVRAHVLLAFGSVVFLGASLACAYAGSLSALVGARSVQGVGGALLLAGSLPVLGALLGSTERGVAVWTMAGTIGAAVGPALGGALTQLFDWRAIFVAQAPVAGVALLATAGSHVAAILEEGWRPPLWRTMPGNAGLALVSGALVGALFLGVLLVIDVFGSQPVAGALIVSVIPVAAVLSRWLAERLPATVAVASGAALLASGLVGLAFLPSSEIAYTLASLALCGVGMGLALPGLTHAAPQGEGGMGRKATLSVGVRHLGLVAAIVIVAPLLAADLVRAADVAVLNGTATIIDAEIPATTKVPLAVDIRDELDRVPRGEVPDLDAAFDANGAGEDPAVRAAQEDLLASVTTAITRGFRRSFLVCAALALLALVPVLAGRRRFVP